MPNQIKDLVITKTFAEDGDFFVLQNPNTNETYKISKSNLIKTDQTDFSALPEVVELGETDFVVVQSGSNSAAKKISKQNLSLSTYLKWGLKDTSGNTVIDISNNGRNGTYNNCILNADGVVLNGTNSIIWTNNSFTQLNPLVVKVAFKTNVSKSQGLWEFRDTQNTSGGSYSPALKISSSGKLSIYGYPNGTRDSSLSYHDNQWHLTICAFESNRIRLFVDQVKILDVPGSALQSFTGFLSLGYSKTTNYFSGSLKDFQVWNSTFSDTQGIQFS